VKQATSLWCGYDPAYLARIDVRYPPEYNAVEQMLVGAIVSGTLPADDSLNPKALLGNHEKTLVARGALEAYARSIGEFPAFLFDTFAPFTEETVTLTPLGKARNRSEATVENGMPVNRGGRPVEYDWNAFTMEIIRHANSIDGLPEKQAELVEKMLNWFSENYDREPATSSVKDRISRIYRYLADHDAEAKNSGP
jgi:hypothetical protein